MRLIHQEGNEDLKPGESVLQVFRNDQFVVKHFCIRRGGCLYIGQITTTNTETKKSLSLDSTAGPYRPNCPLIPDNDQSSLDYYLAIAKKHVG